MPIFLKGDIHKAQEPVTNERLKALLNKQEPHVVRFLSRMWHNQVQDISYAEIRESIMSGSIDEATIERWQQDYSRFVKNSLMPQWKIMMDDAVNRIETQHPGYRFNATADLITQNVAEHATNFVTTCTAQQIEAIQTMIQRASIVQDLSVDELSRIIRPTIGLHKGQTSANLNYYQHVKTSLIKDNPHMRAATAQKRAQEAALKYAERQSRYRANMIARTELVYAHNTGAHYGVKQAQEQGLIGLTRKQWVTAADIRVCDRCRELDMTTVGMDESFPNGSLYPPLHPHCRCVVNYIEE